ncbi:MAG: pyrroline-5-carboxylate reductase [Lachnospiraceae bacterium]|nr:pyrroline-5-carboxylate reductase [Lachnospiraceae bacterium]
MKIGLIGFGNMASAITGGMLKNGFAKPEDIIVSRRDEEKLIEIESKYQIAATTDNREVAKEADVLILAVKPQMLSGVIEEIRGITRPEQLIVSIAAGKSIKWLCEAFGRTVKIVRCMPNTPALVGEACTGICFNRLVSQEEKTYILDLFSCLGMASEVPENLMDVVVGVSGSSPAYVFMFIEAIADAAVCMGMPRKQAYEFTAQAVMGSAKLMLETGKHPGELKDMVCSPAGTTIEAVKVLEEKGMRAALMDAVVRCVERSKEL